MITDTITWYQILFNWEPIGSANSGKGVPLGARSYFLLLCQGDKDMFLWARPWSLSPTRQHFFERGGPFFKVTKTSQGTLDGRTVGHQKMEVVKNWQKLGTCNFLLWFVWPNFYSFPYLPVVIYWVQCLYKVWRPRIMIYNFFQCSLLAIVYIGSSLPNDNMGIIINI